MPPGPGTTVPDPGGIIMQRSKELRESTGPGRGAALENLGDAYTEAGKGTKAIACYQQAWDSGHRPARFLRKFASSLAEAGEAVRAAEILAPALSSTTQPLDDARTLAVHARVLARQGRTQESERTALAARQALAQHGAPDGEIAECWATIGLSRTNSGRFPEARDPFTRARDLYRTAGMVREALRQDLNLAWLDQTAGDLAGAAERCGAIYAEAERGGMGRQAGLALLNRGEALLDLGRFEEAGRDIRAAQRHLVAAGATQLTMIASLDLARLAVESGDPGTGATLAGRCVERFQALGNTHLAVQALVVLARAESLRQDLGSARKHAEEALDLARKGAHREDAARALRVLADVDARDGNAALAVQRLEEVLGQFRTMAMPFEAAVTELRLAAILRRSQSPDRAATHAARAREALLRIGATHLLRHADEVLR